MYNGSDGMSVTKTGETRDRRWNLRVEDSEDALVRAASDLEARRILADRTQFPLDKSEWEQFTELLDRPPKVPSGLRDLFSKPSVFE